MTGGQEAKQLEEMQCLMSFTKEMRWVYKRQNERVQAHAGEKWRDGEKMKSMRHAG